MKLASSVLRTPSLQVTGSALFEARAMVITLLLAALAMFASPGFAQAPNDAQIASIVVTANQVDIDVGKFAHERAHNEAVKNFAKQMMTDHSGVNKQATELAKKLNLTPEDNPTSQSLKKGGEDAIAKLKNLKGADFDRAYIDHEIQYHTDVIGALDKTLLPNTKNAELKALLEASRPAFVGHLELAKKIRAGL